MRTGWTLASTAAGALALGAYAAWRSANAGNPPIEVRGVPDVIGAFAIVGMLAPWAAWFRLCLLDVRNSAGRFASPLRQGFVAGFVVLGSLVPGHLLASAWTAAEDAHWILAPVAFALLVLGSWLAYRWLLDRWFRNATLPV